MPPLRRNQNNAGGKERKIENLRIFTICLDNFDFERGERRRRRLREELEEVGGERGKRLLRRGRSRRTVH